MDKKQKRSFTSKKKSPMAETKESTQTATTSSTIKKRGGRYTQPFDETFYKLAGKDNPPIDERLLKLINTGDVQLTDDRFFKLLKESKEYLQTEPFKEKLAQWTLENNKRMLNRIQTKLKPESRGRRVSITNEFDIKDKYLKNVKLINDFKKAHPGAPNRKLNEMFVESYPDLKVDFMKHNSAKELAYDLTCNQLSISERSLRRIVKYCYPNAHKNIKEIIRKPE